MRIIGLFNKPSVKKIVNVELNSDLTFRTPDNNILMFYEHVGEGSIDYSMIEGTLTLYPNKDVYLIIDDSYEGLLVQSDVDKINKITGFKEILICTSNEKLQGENVIDVNFHLHNPKYDNINVQNHQCKDNFLTRQKKFICLNRQERLHRLQTIDFLLENDLIKHSHASCALHEFLAPLTGSTDIERYSFDKGTENADEYYKKRLYGSFSELNQFSPTNEQKERLLKNLPLVLDIPQYNMNPAELPDLEEYFQSAYWGIITERDFYRSDIYQGWTEKVLKCFIYKNPFVVVGLPHTIKSLQDYGFITFSKYIDESYDNITDDEKRLTAVFDQIKYLGSLNYAELDKMHKDMENILTHNYEHYKKLNNSVPTNLINHMQKWFRN